MAFKPGNKAAKGHGRPKMFEQSIRLALNANDGEALRAIAEKLIQLAVSGDMAAIKEVADRLDGRPHQTATVESFTHNVRNISDDELTAIATGSGSGTAGEAEGAGQSQSLH